MNGRMSAGDERLQENFIPHRGARERGKEGEGEGLRPKGTRKKLQRHRKVLLGIPAQRHQGLLVLEGPLEVSRGNSQGSRSSPYIREFQ